MMGEYRKERLLLEGQVKLIIDPMEFRMALWINGFGLSDAVTGEEIIPLCHSYNLEHVEEAGGSAGNRLPHISGRTCVLPCGGGSFCKNFYL